MKAEGKVLTAEEATCGGPRAGQAKGMQKGPPLSQAFSQKLVW